MDDVLYTASTPDNPLMMTFADAMRLLEQGEIDMEHGLMSWGSNYTFLVTIRHENNEALAIYKPRRGERPLWDFPTGTLCQRETASFYTSESLGWRLVPPTTLRDGPRGEGSLQLFINHNPEEHFFTFDDSMTSQLKKMSLFDAITNNADRKGGHCLVDEARRLWGIDHGLTFNTAMKLRTVIWNYAGQKIADDLLDDLNKLCALLDNPANDYVQRLCGMLANSEIDAVRARVRRLLASKKYPLPGPGPNRPWPPV